MTNELQTAFPTRPLRVLRHGASSSWLNYIAGIAFLAGAIAVLYWQGPALLQDNAIRQNPVVAQDGVLRGGKCKTRKAIFVECEATITYAVDGKRYTHKPDIFFLDFNTGSYSSGVVRSATKPELGTMSIAIDYFWNRVSTVLGFAGLLAAIGVIGFVTGIRNGRQRKVATAEAAPLAPVPVEITKGGKDWRGSSFEFKALVEGKSRTFTSRFGKDEQPFGLLDGRFLATVPAGTATAILLDEGLQRIDLTDEERQRIWAAAYPDPAQAA